MTTYINKTWKEREDWVREQEQKHGRPMRPTKKMLKKIEAAQRKWGNLNISYGIENQVEFRSKRGYWDYAQLTDDTINLNLIIGR